MKTILLGILLLILPFDIFGQKPKFGLYGEIMRSQNILSLNDNVNGDIESENKIGYGLGATFHFNEEKNISFRVSGGLNYLMEEVKYLGQGWEELQSGAIFLKVPVHALFKFGKSDFGLVAGINPSINLVGGKDENNDLNFKPFNIAGDIGFNYYFKIGEKLTLTPELKYSYSFINGLDNSNSSRYYDIINTYLRNRFMLTAFVTW
jgi:hypothetical protein